MSNKHKPFVDALRKAINEKPLSLEDKAILEEKIKQLESGTATPEDMITILKIGMGALKAIKDLATIFDALKDL